MQISKELAQRCFEASKCFLEDGKIDGEYKGDISSYAPSIVQSGLIGAVLFYSVKSKEAAHVRRNKINRALHFVLLYLDNKKEIGVMDCKSESAELFHYIEKKYNSFAERKRLLHNVELALCGLKMAIRFYPSNESNQS